MSRALSRTTLGAVVAVLVVAGCSGSSNAPTTPQTQLVASVGRLMDANTLTTTARLETTAAAAQGLARALGAAMPAGRAQAITSTRLVIETRRTGSGASSYALRVVHGVQTLVEMRVVDGTIYLQGNVASALTLFQERATLADLRSDSAQLPAFGQAFLAGKWVSLQAAVLSVLGGQLGGQTESSAPSEGPKLLAELKGVLSRDVTVTKLGSDSRGDHLEVTGDARKLAADIKSSITSSVPGGGALTDKLTVTGASKPVTLEAWVKDGALTELSVDLVQFAPKNTVPAGATLPLTLTFDQSGDDITAPTGAVPIDLTQLGDLFGALTGSTTSGGSSPSG